MPLENLYSRPSLNDLLRWRTFLDSLIEQEKVRKEREEWQNKLRRRQAVQERWERPIINVDRQGSGVFNLGTSGRNDVDGGCLEDANR